MASVAAGRLEERLSAALPGVEVAARGRICVIATRGDGEGLSTPGRAIEAAGCSPVVVHADPSDLARLLEDPVASRFAAALVRCGPGIDRALGAPAILDLLARGLAVSLLERRLDWVRERKALFGALDAWELEGLPPALVSWLAMSRVEVRGRAARARPAGDWRRRGEA
ncbi:MAG: hypothetical protein JSS68_01910 [Actinobacteria bacterium]|nr:hypothetical protein [Actinomycetota bacterium]